MQAVNVMALQCSATRCSSASLHNAMEADSKERNAPELSEGQATSRATEEALSQPLYVHLILSVLV
jgi:hypothetical protein